jgi:hypothetical protein
VEDRILVLNVLRGLSDRYAHLRTWITRQRPFPTFLEVRDDLVMEELTQGPQPGSTTSTGSSSPSTALAATSPRPTAPPRSAAPPPPSLLGPPPSGPSGGGGAVAVAVDVEGVAGVAGAATPSLRLLVGRRGGTMALLPAPVVRAHLHVALPRHRGRLAPTGGHAHRSSSCWPYTRRLPCYGVDSTLWDSSGGRRMGPGGPGPLVQHHGPDTSGRT